MARQGIKTSINSGETFEVIAFACTLFGKVPNNIVEAGLLACNHSICPSHPTEGGIMELQ